MTTEKLVAGPLRGELAKHEFEQYSLRCGCSCGWGTKLVESSKHWSLWAEHIADVLALASLPSSPPRELTPSQLDKCMEDYDCGTIPRGELLSRINAALAFSPVQPGVLTQIMDFLDEATPEDADTTHWAAKAYQEIGAKFAASPVQGVQAQVTSGALPNASPPSWAKPVVQEFDIAAGQRAEGAEAGEQRELTAEQAEKIDEIISRHKTDEFDSFHAADDLSDYLFGGVNYPGIFAALGSGQELREADEGPVGAALAHGGVEWYRPVEEGTFLFERRWNEEQIIEAERNAKKIAAALALPLAPKVPAPQHPFEVRISSGGDDWEYVRHAVRELLEHVETREPDEVGCSSGGGGGCHSIDLQRREISAAEYRKELAKWHDGVRAERDGGK